MYINSDPEARLFQIIGRNVKYYRQLYSLKKTKITQEKLAEIIDVSTSLIGNLESEKIDQGIGIYTLWKISNVLDVPVGKFFDIPEVEKNQ